MRSMGEIWDENGAIYRSILNNSAMFRGIDLESTRGLLEGCLVREYDPGEVIIGRGKPNRSLYLLLSGRVRIHLEVDLDPIAVLGPGEIVGEMSVMDGQAASAHAVAHYSCHLLVLDEKTVWSMVNSCPKVALNLLLVVSQRLRHGNSLVLARQEAPVDYRLNAIMDATTGLYNRSWLDGMLEGMVKRAKSTGWPLSVLMVDIDHFRRYNDTWGRAAGDSVLYSVARTIERLQPGEIAVRYGGDEFIALLPDRDARHGQRIAEVLCEQAARTKIYKSDQSPVPSVTVSVGVAQVAARDTPESFLQEAEKALSNARSIQGDQVFRARSVQ